jgi:hypothetical protein
VSTAEERARFIELRREANARSNLGVNGLRPAIPQRTGGGGPPTRRQPAPRPRGQR